MPRLRRLFAPGAFYHIIQRGVNRVDIYVDDDDKEDFLDGLAAMSHRFGHRVHAYCLMNNHVHVAIQCGEQPLGMALRSLFGRYAKRFNRRHERSGHLFQERHRAILVATDDYLLELVRYIHLNPVRAGLVTHPEDWAWSSHMTYVAEEAPMWLTTQTILARFAGDEMAASRVFKNYVDSAMDTTAGKPALDFVRGNSKKYDALVPDGYHAQVLSRNTQRVTFPRSLEDTEQILCSRLSLHPQELTPRTRQRRPALARGAMAYLAQWGAGWTIVQLARRYARTESAMSQGAARFAGRLGDDDDLQSILAEITAVPTGELFVGSSLI